MIRVMTHQRIRDGFPGQRMLVLPRPVVQRLLSRSDAPEIVPTDAGYFPNAAWHEVPRPLGIRQTVLIYCVRGRGWSTGRRRRWNVAPGDLLVLPPDAPHVYGADESMPWTIYWMHVAGTRVPALRFLLCGEVGQGVVRVGHDSETVALFEEVYRLLEEGYGQTNLLLASLCAGHLLGRLVALSRARREVSDPRQRIEQVIAFLRMRLDSHIAVGELAAMVNLSPSHFAALFKRLTGYPTLDYFLRLKMQQAARLLDTTTLPIKNVAAQLGYDDQLYFSRQFRKIYGASPAQYRAVTKG